MVCNIWYGSHRISQSLFQTYSLFRLYAIWMILKLFCMRYSLPYGFLVKGWKVHTMYYKARTWPQAVRNSVRTTDGLEWGFMHNHGVISIHFVLIVVGKVSFWQSYQFQRFSFWNREMSIYSVVYLDRSRVESVFLDYYWTSYRL